MGINASDGYSKDVKKAIRNQKRTQASNGTDPDNYDALLALEDATALLNASQGYLRIGYTAGKGFWVRWKWTGGVLAGRYVFARSETLCAALQEVCLNASEVTEGKRTAALDRSP